MPALGRARPAVKWELGIMMRRRDVLGAHRRRGSAVASRPVRASQAPLSARAPHAILCDFRVLFFLSAREVRLASSPTVCESTEGVSRQSPRAVARGRSPSGFAMDTHRFRSFDCRRSYHSARIRKTARSTSAAAGSSSAPDLLNRSRRRCSRWLSGAWTMMVSVGRTCSGSTTEVSQS